MDLGFGPVPPAPSGEHIGCSVSGVSAWPYATGAHLTWAALGTEGGGRKAISLYIINHHKRQGGRSQLKTFRPAVNAQQPVAQWMSRYVVTVAGVNTVLTFAFNSVR